MTPVRIRAAADGDLRRLQDIERAAGGLFRELGMDRVADDAPPPLPVLRRCAHAGGLWVAVELGVDGAADVPDIPVDGPADIPVEGAADIPVEGAGARTEGRAGTGRRPAGGNRAGAVPVAYLMAVPVDGNVHIEQVSVHPAAARRRIGRALIEHVARRARAAGVPALTLCTFADVPWNAPYYERCGFRVLAGDELTPGLRNIRAEEARAGLESWPRVCMRRELTAR